MSLQVIHSTADIKNLLRPFLKSEKKIGFVPTMGALHLGHATLIEKARLDNVITIVSIFVNPTQFNDPSDFIKYPKTFQSDCELLQKLNVDYLFFPSKDEIYSDEYRYKLNEYRDSLILCGGKRPGHFEGVLTVVMKLLNIIKPTNAYFGLKDFQQYQLINEMVATFFLDINIIGVETVREKSGLAMSSRNTRLSENGKLLAAKIFPLISSDLNLEEILKILESQNIQVEYLTEKWERIFIAFFIEGVRLIDNCSKTKFEKK